MMFNELFDTFADKSYKASSSYTDKEICTFYLNNLYRTCNAPPLRGFYSWISLNRCLLVSHKSLIREA